MDALLLPEGLTRFTLQRLGTAGQAWLDELPTLVDFFCATWQVTVTGRPWSNSNVGLVLPVGRRDGTRAVLKLSPHDDGTVAEARGLAFWDGRGAVRLLDCDLDTVALLMERAVPGTTLRELADDAEAIALAADCLWELWRPMAKGGDFSTAAAVAPRWAAQCRAWYEQLGRPLEPRLLDEALDALAQLPPSAPEAVLCHQDAHQENFIRASRRPCLAIDPKPLAAEREFDCGSLLRDRRDELADMGVSTTVRRRLDQLSDGLDRERIAAWGVCQAVHLGLWALQVGLERDGPRLLGCAAAISDARRHAWR